MWGTIFFPSENSVVCQPAEGWPEAMANYTARMLCNSDEVGIKSRICKGSTNPGTWGEINSTCVNKNILTLLTEAQV